MSIKAIRLEIVKPYNESDAENVVTWNELGQVLRDVRYACAKAENYAITQRYLWEDLRLIIKIKMESIRILKILKKKQIYIHN